MIVEKRAAGRAVLGSFFVIGTAGLLWSIAVAAYIIFYVSYIPVRGFTLPLYFQFEQFHNLHALAALPGNRLVSGQPYDVKLHLHLPRTPGNADAGNFMLHLHLQRPQTTGWAKVTDASEVIASESRPAILTYYSPLIEHVHNFFALPLYVFGWRKESEKLVVPLIEGIEFARGWQSIPTQARVEIPVSIACRFTKPRYHSKHGSKAFGT
jgi:seipin